MNIKTKPIVILLNLIFRLFKFLLQKQEDDVIQDYCEELLAIGFADKFILSRSNCPICGNDFAGNFWNCHCLERKDQDKWFEFMEMITLERKGYNMWMDRRVEND